MLEYMDRSLDFGEYAAAPDDDVIICRCEEITRGEIRRAIHDGMFTMTEIRRFLRAGMGLCQGQSCERTVRQILAQELKLPQSSIAGCTNRGPARPIETGVYGRGAEA
jgi:NAD(P)H-nitrite reductase large subunit